MTVSAALSLPAAFLVFFPAFFFAGGGLRKWLPAEGSVFRGACFTGLGMGLCVTFLFFTGLCRLYRWETLIIFLAAAHLAGRRQWADWFRWLTLVCRQFLFGGNRLLITLSCALTAAVLFSMAACFFPETANDALCYQLNLAKIFVWRKATLPEPFDLNSYTPLFMNLLYGAGLMADSVVLSKLFHWWTGILLVACTSELIKTYTSQKTLAAAFGLSLFLTPTVLREMSTTYVDVAAGFFIFLGFILLLDTIRSGRTSGFIIAGLFVGFAVGVKVLVLLAGVPAALAICMTLRKFGRRFFFRAGLAFGAGFLLGAGYWFLRNFVLTGNPVYPYLGNLFGGVTFDYVGHFQEMGPPKSLTAFLLLPWNMTFLPEDFDRGYWIGPLYLVFLPLFIAGMIRDARVRLLGIMGMLYTALWYVFFHNARFLVPVYPFYLVIAACGAASLNLNTPLMFRLGRTFWGVVAVLCLGLILLAGRHARYGFVYLTGGLDQARYLSQLERSYSAAVWVDRNLPQDARILNAEEIRQYYFPREMVRNKWFQALTGYESLGHPDALASFLKGRGITHILTVERIGGQRREAEGYPLLQSLLKAPHLTVKLYDSASVNIREDRYQYRIYAMTNRQTGEVT